ncbi:MAG: hypothetical protein ABIR70_08835 [Bryobacteraceae bacterium]
MRIAIFALVLASPALFAQQRNVTSPTGFGRILFPGGTPPAGANAGSNGTPFGRIIYPGTGAPAVVSAPNGISPTPTPNAPHPGHGGAGLIPYPVYLPAGNYLQYTPPQAPLASNYVSSSQVPDAPVVIVNQYFRPDGQPDEQTQAPVPVRETPRVTAENQDTDIIFLIAMKDHMIYAAKAYWVEDRTLNYITVQGSQNSASLDLVDRELSQRLNRNRSVAFGLPNN